MDKGTYKGYRITWSGWQRPFSGGRRVSEYLAVSGSLVVAVYVFEGQKEAAALSRLRQMIDEQ